MRRRLELLDTSIVVELLEVPYESDHLDEIRQGFRARAAAGTELHLPVAAVVEAGGHVGRIGDGGQRRQCAGRLEAMIRNTLAGEAPWTFNPLAWDRSLIEALVDPPQQHHRLPDSLGSRNLEMGDLLILAEFNRLSSNLDRSVVDVDVWTLDAALRAAVDVVLGH
jgi:hypothetical protein